MHVVTSNLQERQLHRTSKHLKSSENCAILDHYAAGSGNYLPTFRENPIVPILKSQESHYSLPHIAPFLQAVHLAHFILSVYMHSHLLILFNFPPILASVIQLGPNNIRYRKIRRTQQKVIYCNK
jgi:hypothetical protein